MEVKKEEVEGIYLSTMKQLSGDGIVLYKISLCSWQ